MLDLLGLHAEEAIKSLVEKGVSYETEITEPPGKPWKTGT